MKNSTGTDLDPFPMSQADGKCLLSPRALNRLPIKQDQNTSSDSEQSQYNTDGWNMNADHLQ